MSPYAYTAGADSAAHAPMNWKKRTRLILSSKPRYRSLLLLGLQLEPYVTDGDAIVVLAHDRAHNIVAKTAQKAFYLGKLMLSGLYFEHAKVLLRVAPSFDLAEVCDGSVNLFADLLRSRTGSGPSAASTGARFFMALCQLRLHA